MFELYLLVFMCMSVLPVRMYVYHMLVWYLQRPEEDIRPPKTGIKDVCKTPHGYWELNPGPLQELQVLITAKSPL